MKGNITISELINQLAPLIAKELEPIIIPAIINAVKEQIEPQEEIMTREEVINMLKINRSTLYLWTKKGKLKSYGLGNRVYYKRSEVKSAMLALN